MDPELEFQLQCEAQEKQKKAAETVAATSLADASGTYTDPQDGTVYEWDSTRKAWFPKIDSDFLAMYQASYGVPVDPSTLPASSSAAHSSGATVGGGREKHSRPMSEFDAEDIEYDLERLKNQSQQRDPKKPKKGEEKVPLTAEEKAQLKKKLAEPPTWFEVNDEHNRNVYISQLPDDTTVDELVEFMSKCGIVMKDPRTNNYKIKLYRNPDGTIKGDALCTYMKIESVPLALEILDGSYLRDRVVKIERAKFNLKGEFDVEKAKKQKLRKNEKKRLEKAEAKLLDWRPDKLPGTRAKNERVVVIKNMFDPKEFEEDPGLTLEFKKDLQTECEGFGEVKKVVIYDRHPEGIATVAFAEFEHADACVARMNGRWFAGRQLSAAAWDGKSKYKVEETPEEEEKRLGNWEDFLGGADSRKEPPGEAGIPNDPDRTP
ncbi:HIV Tat-specific factor 1 [Hypsibius exemplaris]|uniref:17S U2 SnRNP complex component HTATSF1 n=1 Tax=Hypsibius exemplaris TaxID=2072580 RepID=A0A1W0WW02_HYPEX|nr:HIV Tat-specific factor 1 [Hypsibius exemplaris]